MTHGALNSRFSLAWFGAGLGLTSATQLRPAAFPLGPGESLLAGWAAFALCALLLRPRVADGPLLRRLLVFCVVSAAALAAGAVIALVTYRGPEDGSPLHDSIAFAFAAVVLLTFVAPAGLARRVRGAIPVAMVVVVLPQVALAPLGLLGLPTGPVQPWTGIRYQGWAENPNQLALALLVIPFVGVALARAQPTPGRRALLYTTTALAVLIGVIGSSDALYLAWGGGGALVGLTAWVGLARRPRPTLWSLGVAYAIIPLLLVAVAVITGPTVAALAEARAIATYSEGDQGSLRMALWSNGARAWATSPLVGLGPGAHAGIATPFDGEEAHNTFIDWTASSGLAGLLVYAALLAWIASRAVLSRRPELIAAFVGLVAFSMFHYVLRQPFYWIGLVTVVVLAQAAHAAWLAAHAPAPAAARS